MFEEHTKKMRYDIVWKAPTGWADWFANVNNQAIGNRFMMTAFVFFCIAGLMALLMRVQLAIPENNFMGPEIYNQLLTMHGATMMYLVMIPFLEGLAIYLIPSLIGSREMAYTRLSAFSYWVYLFGGLIFFSSFLFGTVPDAGWFIYPPLASGKFSGTGMDFLLVGLAFVEIAGIVTGIEIVVTILKARAPGMSLSRMPLKIWAWLVTGFMMVLAFATLLIATVLLELDRTVGTKFFDPEHGGSPLLWQHLFWFFGHPDVYIMFLPATGVISMIIPTFARRPIASYTLVVVAIVVMGFMSFGLWMHHMYTTGLPELASGFFIAASMVIGLASGTQVFAWIATLWRTRPELKSPMLFSLGFLAIFVLGGLTGIMVAVMPFDLQAHDTFFVVAHFHYVLIGGVVFPILAGLHYWLPLFMGKMADEKIARWSFYITFVGFNVTFFPMHISGLLGMPRRVYTYSETLNIGGLNLLSTIGAFVMTIGFALVAWNLYRTWKNGSDAPLNPWNAGSLEWIAKEGRPNDVFVKPPVIRQRDPLWHSPTADDRDEELEALTAKLEATPDTYRAILITEAGTGRPQAIQRVSGPSYVPLISALGLFAVCATTLGKEYIAALGALIFSMIVIAMWAWPRDKELDEIRKSGIEENVGLPTEPVGSASTGWWAMVGTITVAGMTFAVLFFSYFYLQLYSSSWPQGALPKPDIKDAALVFGILPLSSFLMMSTKTRIESHVRSVRHVLALVVLALLFLGGTIWLSAKAPFAPSFNAYASIFHVSLWTLGFAVLVGLALLAATWLRLRARTQDLRKGYVVLQGQVTSMYWQFVVVAGILSFLVLFVSPYLLIGRLQ
jgi:cytochrome c oxidase subunit I+III